MCMSGCAPGWCSIGAASGKRAAYGTMFYIYVLCLYFMLVVMVFLSVLAHKVFYQVVSFFWRGAVGNSVGRGGPFLEYHTVTGNSCSFFESNI